MIGSAPLPDVGGVGVLQDAAERQDQAEVLRHQQRGQAADQARHR